MSIKRFAGVMERHAGFACRVFTEGETAQAEEMVESRRREFLAGRFAVKEAVMKALGTGMSHGVAFTDVEVQRTPSGRPAVLLHGPAREMSDRLGLQACDVSIAHDAGIAIAFVVMM